MKYAYASIDVEFANEILNVERLERVRALFPTDVQAAMKKAAQLSEAIYAAAPKDDDNRPWPEMSAKVNG